VRVAVVGGGVVGLCVAFDLARHGAEVVLLERAACGSGASLRNGGWVTPALSTPLSAPGAVGQALLAIAHPRSPFKVRARLDPALVAWSWRFWRASAEGVWRGGAAQLAALNESTLRLFDQLRDHGVAFEMHDTGLIFVSRTMRELATVRQLFSSLAELGYTGAVDEYGPAEVCEREPALNGDVVGAVHAHSERHVRPESLIRGLRDAAKRAGVRVIEHAEVQRMSRSRGQWTLATQTFEQVSERVVVAAGIWSRSLLRQLGLRLPLEGAKGYSITAAGIGLAPRHALYLTEAKVGFTPFDDAGRLSGTFELGGHDSRLHRARLDAITKAAKLYLRDWRPQGAVVEWAGVRPLAPDGLPLIGAVSGHDGLFVATGHGMVGVTLSPGTAAALTPLVLEDRLVPALAGFRPDRFGRRGHA
jgi:D-amino-acid dehydrogenase